MKNIKISVKGNALTIEVDLTKDFGPSKSGKTTVIASTEGIVKLEGKEGVIIGVNVNKRRQRSWSACMTDKYKMTGGKEA